MKRNYLIISILLLTFVVASGCGNLIDEAVDSAKTITDGDEDDKKEVKAEKEQTEEQSELGDFNIFFCGEILEEGDNFIVEGKSNLIPGSRIVGEVIVDEEETVFSDTSEMVNDDGTFYMELEHHQYGEAEIIVRFDYEGVQEDEIKRHYGEKGQNLEGPFIYKHETYDGIFNKAEVKIDYAPSQQNDLALQAPDWYELPEDYGDARVWIEVEDITEDGEYFYIHGRTNILEGSVIRVSYKHNKGNTTIKPDGSFDIKIDYEYLEDKEIVITFEPSAYQWNEIEEAYGATGQKLVGNLVVSDKYNTDKQYIEKRIPWDNKDAQSSVDEDVSEEMDEDSSDVDDEADDEESNDKE